MKENTDLFSLGVGLIASLLKGIKKRLKMRPLIVGTISGAILAWGTLGVVEFFMHDLDLKIVILVSYIAGWVASEITDVLDESVRDAYDIIHAWFKSKFNK